MCEPLPALPFCHNQLLWPLYIKRNYNWDDSEYSVILLSVSVVSAASMAVCPKLESYFGEILPTVAALVLSGSSAIFGLSLSLCPAQRLSLAAFTVTVFLSAGFVPVFVDLPVCVIGHGLPRRCRLCLFVSPWIRTQFALGHSAFDLPPPRHHDDARRGQCILGSFPPGPRVPVILEKSNTL